MNRDGSAGEVPAARASQRDDGRLRYRLPPANRELDAALNERLDSARGAGVAYLPSDDLYHPAAAGDARPGPRRWIGRGELESDDLERLFFAPRCPPNQPGIGAATRRVTCTWTDKTAPWRPGQVGHARRVGSSSTPSL